MGKSVEDVSGIIKQTATGAAANQWKAHGKLQLLVEDEHAQSAYRKTGHGIARPGLIEAEAAESGAAAGKEAFR